MAQDEHEGRDPDFHEATKKAWENAKSKGNEPGLYEIKRIIVETENPIREYRVTIKKA